jgi:hypothetical protein
MTSKSRTKRPARDVLEAHARQAGGLPYSYFAGFWSGSMIEVSPSRW